jgi:hypothetical protein
MLVQDIYSVLTLVHCHSTNKYAAELYLCTPCRHVEGVEITAPHVPNLGIASRWMGNFMPWLHNPSETAHSPPVYEAGWTLEVVWM